MPRVDPGAFVKFGGLNCIGQLINANFNTVSDQQIIMFADAYILDRIIVVNASIEPSLAVGGIYRNPNKVTPVSNPGQVYTGLTAARKYIRLTLNPLISTDALLDATLFFSLTTPQGSACNADIYLFGDVIS